MSDDEEDLKAAKLVQMCYFTTIRAKTDIKDECVEELKQKFKKNKKVLQFAMVVEKQSKGIPCTHHLHAYIQYVQPIQLATLKKNIKAIVVKFHGPEIDGSYMKPMMKTNTCYVYKDYIGKYDDTINIHGDDFDSDLFKKHMPDEAMQALLQAAQPNRPITTLWANHEEKWRIYSPDDLSPASCHRYLTDRFYVLKDLDPVSDPRKLKELIAGIFRYTHQIRNMSRSMTAFEEALDEELEDQNYMDAPEINLEYRGKKRPRDQSS